MHDRLMEIIADYARLKMREENERLLDELQDLVDQGYRVRDIEQIVERGPDLSMTRHMRAKKGSTPRCQ